MVSFFSRFRKAVAALVFMVSFCMCRKSTPSPVEPNDRVEANPAELVGVSLRINEVFGGYYIALPEHYKETSKLYPLIIFLHGAGQMGNGSDELHYLLNDGIGKLLKDKKLPPAFNINRQSHSFIVVSPQFSRQPHPLEVAEFIQYIKTTYRVDQKRLYLAGLSLGSRVATLVAARFPSAFAALVPIAGVAAGAGLEDRCDSIATHNLPVWAFHNLDDPMANADHMKSFITVLNGFSPPIAPRLTLFDVYGHDAWTTALSPDYRENGMNIYEWMLQYSR